MNNKLFPCIITFLLIVKRYQEIKLHQKKVVYTIIQTGSGILYDLYYKTWKLFFDNTIEELQGKHVLIIDFYDIEEKWTYDKKIYGNKPNGDVLQVAKEVYKQVFGN